MTNPEITDRISMNDYVRIHGITAKVTRDDGLQNRDGWQHHAYRVQLTHGWNGAKLTTPWTQGLGITTSPSDDPASILDSLVLDATSGRDHADVEDFAEEFGYEMETRQDRAKVSAIYRACVATEAKLIKFLGGKAELENLIENVESL